MRKRKGKRFLVYHYFEEIEYPASFFKKLAYFYVCNIVTKIAKLVNYKKNGHEVNTLTFCIEYYPQEIPTRRNGSSYYCKG